MLERLRQRKEWMFFAVLPRADGLRATGWGAVVVLRGLLPIPFAIAMGMVVSAVQHGGSLVVPLTVFGATFVLLQVLSPIQTAFSRHLGDRTATYLYDRLTEACVRPQGMGHLEDPSLTADLTAARDFDLGMTAPPLSYSMDFIASGLVGMLGGLASAAVLFGYAWWAPIVLAVAWLSTHWLLRESAVWRDRETDEVRGAQRAAEYDYRLAVDPPASKELRLFGLVDWTIARFVAKRTHLHTLQYEATRLRERPLVWCVLIVTSVNLLIFMSLAVAAASGRLDLGQLVMYAQAAIGTSAIAFGGFSWALDAASAPVAAVARLEPAMAIAGRLRDGSRSAEGHPAQSIHFRDVTFGYPGGAPVLDGFTLTVPAGTSLAIVGQNGAGKTTLAKLLCRLYDPQSGAIVIDGTDLRQFDLASWRTRLAVVFQDFIRFDLPLRDNVAPGGAPDHRVLEALEAAGAGKLARLDTVLSRAYPDGIDLSGGQWQRVALARALCGVKTGARVVLLDEPTAQLDVRGEAEIFQRLLAETRHCTTILISHRFSTVRHADRICVLEHGRVVELGTHDELMALGGRYYTMFDLQARRFTSEDEEGRSYDVLA